MPGSGGCRFASSPGDETVIERLVLFGATGDLAGRYLFPALAALTGAGELPEGGGSALSVRGDEAEWAWRVVNPVLEDWRAGRVPLEEYPAGSDGPRH